MRMLVYSALDLVDEYARIKTKDHPKKTSKLYNESTYLGSIYEGKIGEFEFDVYGYISNTKYKYILLKNDDHQ